MEIQEVSRGQFRSVQNEKDFRTIIDSIPSGLIMVDRNGKIVLSNAEAEKLFGYSPNELLGKGIEELIPSRLRTHHPQYREGFMREPSKRQMGAGRDLMGLRKDKTEVPVEIGLNHLQTDQGLFIIATIVDITERKRVESKLHQAYEEVQQKNQEMEQFVYTVSHDLKAPLVTSMSFIGFLKDDLRENRMDDVVDSLNRLEKAQKKMQELISDLLQLSRVGRLELRFGKVDLNDLLNDVLEYISSKGYERKAEIDIPSGLPVIVGDQKRIQQVFENLLNNALKYGASESGRKVQILWKETEAEFRICVKDFGPGIEKQFHKKVFGLFQRLHSDSEGTGVGLTIVSRIMQLHGGRAWVESEPGHGAEFWVAFPKRDIPSKEGVADG